jgi:hypothetical protein
MTMAPLPYRIVERRQETADTATLTLQPVAGAIPPRCRVSSA